MPKEDQGNVSAPTKERHHPVRLRFDAAQLVTVKSFCYLCYAMFNNGSL